MRRRHFLGALGAAALAWLVGERQHRAGEWTIVRTAMPVESTNEAFLRGRQWIVWDDSVPPILTAAGHPSPAYRGFLTQSGGPNGHHERL